ncbi:ATP-binding protein, partial [Salmonella enterica]|nr:ATP-binding protein [Salmonella enterica subsp. enterica serovar Panama]EMD2987365.1 ATP-binding protein [Salmonella enterica]EMD3059865.1 ATP-binding protein [Salmonella enterica]EMD3064465.1 ATP-binding protein [Salmonella enterica]EMD3078207.1 ATP-binding protein [Salmonella enterica]
QIAQPGAYKELGFEERLSLLASEELTCRENRKAESLVKQVRFRLSAELSKLDYRSSRALDKALIRSLGQGNWLNLKQNLLLTGATGSGKTYLACALGHNACQQGYKVCYYWLKTLIDLCCIFTSAAHFAAYAGIELLVQCVLCILKFFTGAIQFFLFLCNFFRFP